MSSLINLSHRQSVKLSEVTITKSGVLSSKTASISTAGNIPFIKAKDIHFNTIYSSSQKLPEEIIKKPGVEIVPKQSLLIAVSGPTVGSIAILGTDAIVESNIYYSIINADIINPLYLYYFLCSKRNQIVKSSKYCDRVSIVLLLELNVPIPALEVQKKIAAELEKQLKYGDGLVTKVNKEIDELNKQRQDILVKAFKDITFCSIENKVVFNSSNVVQIKECGLVQAGKTPSGSIKQYFGKEFPFFNTSALEQGMNILSSKTYLSQRGIREARSFKANSVLICNDGPFFGKAGIARTIGAASSQMISITPSEDVIPEFLYYQIISAHFQEQMKSRSKNYSIGRAQFADLYIELPSLEKQKKILASLQAGFSALFEKAVELTIQLQNAELIKTEAFLNAFERVEV